MDFGVSGSFGFCGFDVEYFVVCGFSGLVVLCGFVSWCGVGLLFG